MAADQFTTQVLLEHLPQDIRERRKVLAALIDGGHALAPVFQQMIAHLDREELLRREACAQLVKGAK